MLDGFRQTRLGQPAAEKHGTASAGLMREYGVHMEKTRKYLPAVARLQAGRSSRAGLQVNPQMPGNPPCVGGIAMSTASFAADAYRRPPCLLDTSCQ